MQSDTHVAGAVAIQSSLFLAANIQSTELMVGGAAIAAGGALFPDFDHAGSYISNRYPLLGFIGRLFSHRGFSHTLFFWLMMTIGAYIVYTVGVVNSWWTYSHLIHPAIFIFVLGGLSHLGLDCMTPSGVPWFGPFSWERYSLNVFKTGSIFEWLFKLGLFGLIVCFYFLFGGF